MESRLGQILMLFYPYSPLAALLVGAIMLIALGVNPLVAYQALLQGAFSSKNAFAETQGNPLLLIGVGICTCRGNVINIMERRQMIMGALVEHILGLPDQLPAG